MKEIVIFGAGGFGKEVLEIIREINIANPLWQIVGFYDNYLQEGTVVNGIAVLGGIENLHKSSVKNVVVALGNPEARSQIINSLNGLKHLPTIIHPKAVLPEGTLSIGQGSIIAANVFLSVNISIGIGVIINVGCSIGHDVEIGNFCTINPGARVSGNVRIGNFVFIAVGAILNNNIEIVDDVKIGAGSVVLKSVEKKSTLFGNPARILLN